MHDEIAIQRDYYRKTADQYDDMHINSDVEHDFALAFMLSMIEFLSIGSMLDIGSGTGRALLRAKKASQNLKVLGIEPSSELRKVGYTKGLSQNELIDGDAQKLDFSDGALISSAHSRRSTTSQNRARRCQKCCASRAKPFLFLILIILDRVAS